MKLHLQRINSSVRPGTLRRQATIHKSGRNVSLLPSLMGWIVIKLESKFVHMRGHAARALAKKGKEAVPRLLDALKHPHWHVQRCACDDIRLVEKDAAANAADALPALTEALDDTDFYVRDGAALAIAAIGAVPEDAAPFIEDMIRNEEDSKEKKELPAGCPKIHRRWEMSSPLGAFVSSEITDQPPLGSQASCLH